MAYSKECSFSAGGCWACGPVIIVAVLDKGGYENKLKMAINELVVLSG